MYSHKKTSLLKSSQEISKQHMKDKTKETFIKYLVFSNTTLLKYV
jgi:hypothetical protein